MSRAAQTLPRSLALLTLIVLSASPIRAPAEESELKDFVTRRGDQLYEGDKLFRFISFNIPNLQVVEDNFAAHAKTPWAWPNEFELTDAMESVRQMGGTVVRTYVLSVRREGSDMGDNVHVLAPGKFNEEAFEALDIALEAANRAGVRVIIPLVDRAKWHGGCAEYAAFRGKDKDAFWTDEQVIADFEETVRFVLTRVNTRTGVAYRDDPAILGWETGNEIDSTPEWTRRIAALIKRLDPRHLVIDGRSMYALSPEQVAEPNVDVLTTHHYPETGADYVAGILAAREATRGKKPYFVGEFGFTPIEKIEQVYDAVIANDVSGALLWSLRYHHRDGGFYWHFEPLGARLYKAYHWPGFPSGQAYDERRVLDLTRAKAFEIRGLPVPRREPPAAPILLPIADAAHISWQGSAGAREYQVERAGSNSGPWSIVAASVDDTAVQYQPLFNDETAAPGKEYFYRVLARNEAGVSPHSNAVGPVRVECRTLIDEGRDLAKAASTAGEVRTTTGDDRRRREDVHRLLIPPGGAVIYQMPTAIQGWHAVLYRGDEAAEVSAHYSADGQQYSPAAVERSGEPRAVGDYDYLPRIIFRGDEVPAGVRWLKIEAAGGEIELARLEIRYGG